MTQERCVTERSDLIGRTNMVIPNAYAPPVSPSGNNGPSVFFGHEHSGPTAPIQAGDDPQRAAPGSRVLAYPAVRGVDGFVLFDLARIGGPPPPPPQFIGAQLDIVAMTVLAPVPMNMADQEGSGVLAGLGQCVYGSAGNRHNPQRE